ncbi:MULTISPECIES: hypothetical protein [Polaromonas]|uniref:Uncharacterized protein n=1 Tax=Polaromonas aquatica TaxID=332657 RepID=A0ABW1U4I1_9BURK
MTAANMIGSGDGTRPTTDGGVDNVGAAGTFTPGQGGKSAPAPKEKMSETKKDSVAAKSDDSAPLDMRQSMSSSKNTEPVSSNLGRK